ncbi:BTAD domain-containing putative transcriptional regulator [Streptomyces sp. NPDC005551]|uniref:AfsR/SARP family transcriptional regulator n=1 Tax=Streptomyces sp. NPDC005551 TaxID=3364725 RepID=UPI0036A7C16B
MDIDVLGALDVRENGVSIAPTAPKPRQVLALLALHADRVVPVDSLIEELWSGRPPRSARTTLQTYVLQLRELIAVALAGTGVRQPGTGVRQLGAGVGESGAGVGQLGAGVGESGTVGESGAGVGELGAGVGEPGAVGGAGVGGRCAKDVLVTLPGGYLLCSGGGTSDVREFERLAGLGYRAMDAGDFTGAARSLAAGLGLWSGAAFADVQSGVQLAMEVRRLDESRLCALDQRIEADLRLGRHREVLAELTVLTSRYRTHENLHAQFMIALHRSGRRGEALSVFLRLRATLGRELGLEPSARLRGLQHTILTAGPESVPVPARAVRGAAGPQPVPLAPVH